MNTLPVVFETDELATTAVDGIDGVTDVIKKVTFMLESVDEGILLEEMRLRATLSGRDGRAMCI